MNKRGQFYIVAAIIIVLAVAGIASVKTYAIVKPKPRSIESMGSELKEESFQMVEYGIHKGENITSLLNNFTSNYSEYFLKKTNKANVIFVYGNKSDLYSAKYDKVNTGRITATIGTQGTGWSMDTSFTNRTRLNVAGNSVTVTIFNKDYSFDLRDNEMFYFVIVEEKEGEVYVEKN